MLLRVAFLVIAYLVYAQYSHLHDASTRKSAQKRDIKGSVLSYDREHASETTKQTPQFQLKSQELIKPSAFFFCPVCKIQASNWPSTKEWSPNLRRLYRLSPSQSPPQMI